MKKPTPKIEYPFREWKQEAIVLIDESYKRFGMIQVMQFKGDMALDESSRHRIYVGFSGNPNRELLDEILEEREDLKIENAKLQQDLASLQERWKAYRSEYPVHQHKFLFWKI